MKKENERANQIEMDLKNVKKETEDADEEAAGAEKKGEATTKEIAEAITKMVEAKKQLEKCQAIRNSEAMLWQRLLDSKEEQIKELKR